MIERTPKKKAKYTPGPWEIASPTRVWSTHADGGAVCIAAEPECNYSSDFQEVKIASKRFHEACANARLIAAAPDLLEALKAVVRVADRKTFEFDAARAAIARAEGRV